MKNNNGMSRYLLLILLAAALLTTPCVRAHETACRLTGRVTDARTGEAVCGAAIVVGESRLWAISDHEGRYLIPGIADRQIELHVTCLGYVACTIPLTLRDGENTLDLTLREANLSIDEVVVTAQTRTETSGSSQVIDRRTIEHAQLININEIGSLLPGGKTAGDQNLTSGSSRIALHAGGGSEMGNASFGTAVELDGMRIGNNASTAETAGTDLRNIGVSNIESVEVVRGIPSVEYGNLTSGLVNIRRRARFRPNLVGKEAEVYEAIRSHESLLTSEIRKLCGFQRTNRLKGQPVLDVPEPKPKRSPSLETILTRLEMRTFVVIADFEYRIDRYGQPYGWGLARYSTPEVLFKSTRLRAAACFKPDVSLERVCRHLSYYLPGATLEEIESLIDY